MSIRETPHRIERRARELATEAPGLEVLRADAPTDRLVVSHAEQVPAEAATKQLAGWEADLGSARVLAERRRHNVYRLDTQTHGPIVLKYTNPGKTRRRSAVQAFLTGWLLHRALPGAIPEPLMAVDHYASSRITGSCLVSRYVKGVSVRDLRQQGAVTAELQETVGRFLARLHRSGVFLQDCRPDNFLVTRSAAASATAEQRLTLPDLEALLPGHPSRWRAARLLLKLYGRDVGFERIWSAYWQERGEALTTAESLAFWGAYFPVRRLRRRILHMLGR
ncbi:MULTISPECIES: phosphotransferase [Halorhodospira]|uniref:phosphotransferase n=1 Tax=Halorhodospira TaxID=85108 RepID=UPI001EE7EE90|nr:MULTISPECIES: phosphotransferase [Halorhodospira]MCG5528881.1 phosphotransferase [Halorhodospira halophila]MCG5544267.1 phosphotransferase [Halorhodospira sp. 9628]